MKICISGAKSGYAGSADTLNSNLDQVFSHSGKNFGNYLIGYSLLKHFPNSFYLPLLEKYVIEINKFDILIIAASNFLNVKNDISEFSKIIQKINIPIVFFGLGVQAEKFDKNIVFPKGTENFISLLKEKSVTVGVRGEYTAEILNSRGVKNLEVIGCPSCFLNGKKSFSIDNPVSSLEKVQIHGNPVQSNKFIHHLYQLFKDQKLIYLAQSEIHLIKFSLNFLIGKNDDKAYSFLRKYFSLKDIHLSKDFIDFILRDTKFYTDVDYWLSVSSTLSFSVGGRFHGNMAAFQKGVPCLWVTFDTRIKELCDYLCLPNLSDHEILKLNSKEDVLKAFSTEKFNGNYGRLLANYLSFIKNAGLPSPVFK